MTLLTSTRHEKLWQWFGLSRASFLVLPRVLMHEMPKQWQDKMTGLLQEYDNTFDTSDVCDSTTVLLRKNGKIIKTPEWIQNYRRPDRETIQSFKKGATNE
jgi:hypothetical protein